MSCTQYKLGDPPTDICFFPWGQRNTNNHPQPNSRTAMFLRRRRGRGGREHGDPRHDVQLVSDGWRPRLPDRHANGRYDHTTTTTTTYASGTHPRSRAAGKSKGEM